jgi:hypothetical protein
VHENPAKLVISRADVDYRRPASFLIGPLSDSVAALARSPLFAFTRPEASLTRSGKLVISRPKVGYRRPVSPDRASGDRSWNPKNSSRIGTIGPIIASLKT